MDLHVPPPDITTAYSEIFIGGRHCRIAGDPDDSYFQSALSHTNGMRCFAGLAAAATSPDGVILDIGGNIGLSALTFASQVPTGKVFVFEPSPGALNYLRENVDANSPENMEVIPLAVGAEEGAIAFHVPLTFSAGGQVLSEHHASTFGLKTVNVEMTTVDKFVGARGLKNIQFIKIDVEGFESDVLLGAARTIADFEPVIIAEMNSFTMIAIRNQNPREFIQAILRDYKFVFWIADDGSIHRITPRDLYSFMNTNLVAHSLVSNILFSNREGWIPRYLALL